MKCSSFDEMSADVFTIKSTMTPNVQFNMMNELTMTVVA